MWSLIMSRRQWRSSRCKLPRYKWTPKNSSMDYFWTVWIFGMILFNPVTFRDGRLPGVVAIRLCQNGRFAFRVLLYSVLKLCRFVHIVHRWVRARTFFRVLSHPWLQNVVLIIEPRVFCTAGQILWCNGPAVQILQKILAFALGTRIRVWLARTTGFNEWFRHEVSTRCVAICAWPNLN